MATQTITTSSEIPDVLKPFYKGEPGVPGLIDRGISSIFPGGLTGQQAFQTQFAPVFGAGLMGAGQIAPMSQFQQEVGTRLAGMQLPGAFDLAQQAGQEAAAGFMGAPGVAAPQLTQYQMGAPEMFTSDVAKRYMSPYMQSVVDAQQRAAIEAAKRAQLGGNLAAARLGTYGGARQALLQGERESGLRQTLGDIQARGLQEAFTQAQGQFERDRAAGMGAGQQNLAALLGVQQLGAGQSLEAQRANQAAALQAASGLGGLAQTFGGLGTQRLAGELDLTKTMGAFGDLQRNIAQQGIDAQRDALMQQAQYGQTQVGQLSNLLRGIPLTDTTQKTTTPPPSFASQLTGMGLTGIGLYNLLSGGK